MPRMDGPEATGRITQRPELTRPVVIKLGLLPEPDAHLRLLAVLALLRAG